MKILYEIVSFVFMVSLTTSIGLFIYDLFKCIFWMKDDPRLTFDSYFPFSAAIAIGCYLYGVFLED